MRDKLEEGSSSGMVIFGIDGGGASSFDGDCPMVVVVVVCVLCFVFCVLVFTRTRTTKTR